MCNCLLETNFHLFQCQHKLMQTAQEDLVREFQINSDSPTITQFFANAIIQVIQNKNWRPDINTIQQEWLPVVLSQQEIGWSNILRGRLTKSLTEAIDQQTNHHGSGEKWIVASIKSIWKTMLKLWSIRNSTLHDKTREKEEQLWMEIMHNKVQKCYEVKHQLTAIDRAKLFDSPIEELLRKDKETIKAWLTMAVRVIRLHRRQDKTSKNRKSRSIMESYVQWKPIRIDKTTQIRHQNKTYDHHDKNFTALLECKSGSTVQVE